MIIKFMLDGDAEVGVRGNCKLYFVTAKPTKVRFGFGSGP